MQPKSFAKALIFSAVASVAGASMAAAEPVQQEVEPVQQAETAADSLHLVLNLPTYRLELWDGSEKIESYPVTIGMNKYQTPTGSFRVSRIEWNPGWTPPDSPWAEGKEKAGPGKDSPMGRVKMQFDDALYIHGTWVPKQLGSANSHGCVRLSNQNALALARLIATREGVLSAGEITALEKNSKRTRSVRLPHAVPLRIRYDLTETLADGQVKALPDPYHWAKTQESAPSTTAQPAAVTADQPLPTVPTVDEPIPAPVPVEQAVSIDVPTQGQPEVR
jgi:murein L,D-transpeptidase YcbB/YkuD